MARARPKIRHLVFHTSDPERLARFYLNVMRLEILHRATNGSVLLTNGYMNLPRRTNKTDGKPSGFNQFGFLVEDKDDFMQRFEKFGYRAPLKRPVDRHYARYRAIDSDCSKFNIPENGCDEIRPDRVPVKAEA